MAAAKGLYLAKITIVERDEGGLYTYHDKHYVIVWVVVFLVKVVFSRAISIIFHEPIVMWNTIWYVAVYYIFKLIGLYGFHREMFSGSETGTSDTV